MERMKPSFAATRCRLSRPAPSAKPTFDFYFGSRQRSTWGELRNRTPAGPATSGAGARAGEGLLGPRGRAWRTLTPRTHEAQGRAASGAGVGLGGKEWRP